MNGRSQSSEHESVSTTPAQKRSAHSPLDADNTLKKIHEHSPLTQFSVLAEMGSESGDEDKSDAGVSGANQNPQSDLIPALKVAFQEPWFEEILSKVVNKELKSYSEALESRLLQTERINTVLSNKVKSLESKVQEQELCITNLEQYSRRENLRISNEWPESKTEGTEKLVLQLSEALGADVKQEEISRCHRVGKPGTNGKPRPVLVRFSSYRARQKLFQVRSKLKDEKGPNENVFINEDLCRARANLAYLARAKRKAKKINDTWVYGGKVFIKDKQNNVSVVPNKTALDSICGDHIPQDDDESASFTEDMYY